VFIGAIRGLEHAILPDMGAKGNVQANIAEFDRPRRPA
jgi:hypothetical protein